MDTGLYFYPVDFTRFHSSGKIGKNTLGYQIQQATLKGIDTPKSKIRAAIIGVPYEAGSANKGTSKAPSEIRKYLYQLSDFPTPAGIIDLGDLKLGKKRQDVHYALRDIIDYLNDSNIISVVLGGGQDLSIGISRALGQDTVISVVDSRVDIALKRQVIDSSCFITKVLREKKEIYHLQMIGIQSHLVSPAVLEFLREKTFDYITLGQLRDDFPAVEPVLRNTGFLSFDISAVRQADAPGHPGASPNGLFSEEACRIAHYAGISNRLKTFGLFEVNPLPDKSGTTCHLAAQMIWYFLEGMTCRRNEDPSNDKSAFTKYYVKMDNSGEQLVFYNHVPTDRWWIEFAPGKAQNRTIPCSKNDYMMAVRQEIPDVWWKFIRKTERLSK